MFFPETPSGKHWIRPENTGFLGVFSRNGGSSGLRIAAISCELPRRFHRTHVPAFDTSGPRHAACAKPYSSTTRWRILPRSPDANDRPSTNLFRKLWLGGNRRSDTLASVPYCLVSTLWLGGNRRSDTLRRNAHHVARALWLGGNRRSDTLRTLACRSRRSCGLVGTAARIHCINLPPHVGLRCGLVGTAARIH